MHVLDRYAPRVPDGERLNGLGQFHIAHQRGMARETEIVGGMRVVEILPG